MPRKVNAISQQRLSETSRSVAPYDAPHVLYDAMYPRSIIGTSKLVKSWSNHPSFNWLDYHACADWIAAAGHQLTLFFREQGLRVPMSGLRFGLGAAQERASGALGMCVYSGLTTSHILMAPARMDSMSFLSVLIHELLHVIVPGGHTPEFKSICAQLDLNYRSQGHDIPTTTMGQRIDALSRLLPQAPHNLLLPSPSLTSNGRIASHWAPKLGIYCRRCGNLQTRWFAERRHQSSCPRCDILLYEIEIPAERALDDLHGGGIIYTKPWTGGVQDTEDFDRNALLGEIIPVKACRMQLNRANAFLGLLRKRIGITWLPARPSVLGRELSNRIRPVGWTLDAPFCEAQLGRVNTNFGAHRPRGRN